MGGMYRFALNQDVRWFEVFGSGHMPSYLGCNTALILADPEREVESLGFSTFGSLLF